VPATVRRCRSPARRGVEGLHRPYYLSGAGPPSRGKWRHPPWGGPRGCRRGECAAVRGAVPQDGGCWRKRPWPSMAASSKLANTAKPRRRRRAVGGGRVKSTHNLGCDPELTFLRGPIWHPGGPWALRLMENWTKSKPYFLGRRCPPSLTPGDAIGSILDQVQALVTAASGEVNPFSRQSPVAYASSESARCLESLLDAPVWSQPYGGAIAHARRRRILNDICGDARKC
jgi:hypothetical protein